MRAIRRMKGDEDGTILVFVAISLAVLLGMVALSFDLGRMASTQTELQSFADNVALAAAGELDGNPDAITRAQAAAAALIADTQSFGLDGQPLDSNDRALDGADVTLTFLSALDTTDNIPPYSDTVIAAPYDAKDASDAIFVRVDVTPHNVPMAFASVLNVLRGQPAPNANVGATATAGFTQYACDIAPLMFCEPSGGVAPGQMVRLHAGGNGFWGPGNFGYLDVTSQFIDPTGPCASVTGQANITRCLLGAYQRTTQCYNLRGVNTSTGQQVGITVDPFNFRFDRFANNASSQQNDPNFAPAPNVIQGYEPTPKGNGGNVDPCNLTASTTSMGLPHGSEFDGTANADVRFGSMQPNGTGTFAPGTPGRTAYVNMNYGGIDPHPTATTRWEYYNAEINAHGGAGSSTPILGAPRLETGRPQCSPNQNPNPERRVVVAAGINCDPAAGGTEINGNSTNVPVEHFYTFFMTEPMRPAPGNDLDFWGEVIDVVGGVGSTPEGIFHDVVQLYR